jgi:hypothetical protein
MHESKKGNDWHFGIKAHLIMFVRQNSAVPAESDLSQWLSRERGDDDDQWDSVSEGAVLGGILAGLGHRRAV